MDWKLLGMLALFAALPAFCIAGGFADMSGKAVSQLNSLADLLRSFVPPLGLALVTLAGIVYSIGQVFDANTRRNVQNWSLSIVMGTVIGVLIVVAAPYAVGFLIGMAG